MGLRRGYGGRWGVEIRAWKDEGWAEARMGFVMRGGTRLKDVMLLGPNSH